MQDHLNRGTDVALFIDWENFKISLAVGHRTPNVSALKEEVSNYGRVVIAKAYADWVTRAPELRGASQFINDPPSLYAAGIEPVFVPTRAPSPGANNANGVRTGRIKNSVDVKMTADCIEIAHSYPNINIFVLVSGDSDFIHVVNALRTMGKQVTVIGVSWSTSRRLADQVDTLVLYDVDVDPVAPVVEAAPVVSVAAATASGSNEQGDLQDIIRSIEEIIRDERKAGGNPLLTSIKQRLMRRYPAFDEKKLGYSGFKRLMARVAQGGNVRLITAGLVDWAIMSDEDIPEGATEATFSSPNARPGRRRGRPPRFSQNDDETSPESVDAKPADSSDRQDTDQDQEAVPAMVANGQHGREDRLDADSLEGASPEVTATENVDPKYSVPEDAAAASSGDPNSPSGENAELAQAMQDAISSLAMPAEPDDGQLAERVSDLIIMANTLEHQEGISHVAFNFLVSEICDALSQGLEAGHDEITQRWSQASSRTYVSKILRSLSDADFFIKGNHSWRDETSGQNRRRRTFNLNQEHPLVQQVVAAHLGNGSADNGSTDIGTGSSAYVDPYASLEPTEATNPLKDTEAVPAGNYMEDDEDDYESGKEAAEARAETGFISRLFRPRATKLPNRR
jgi:uncharacterized LabA/DUF88 family protein